MSFVGGGELDREPFFITFQGFNRKGVELNHDNPGCGICHFRLRQGEQAFVSEEMRTAYHSGCAKATKAFQEHQEEANAVDTSFQYIWGYDHKEVDDHLYQCGLCHLKFRVGDQGYISEKLRTAYHEECAQSTNAFQEWLHPENIPIGLHVLSKGAPKCARSAGLQKNKVESSGGFFYRNRYPIAMVALGMTVAMGFCWEWMKSTTMMHHEFCFVPNGDANSLYCSEDNGFDHPANQSYFRFQPYSIWKSAGEPPLTFDELPPHDLAPPQILASWTTNAVQMLWNKVNTFLKMLF